MSASDSGVGDFPANRSAGSLAGKEVEDREDDHQDDEDHQRRPEKPSDDVERHSVWKVEESEALRGPAFRRANSPN